MRTLKEIIKSANFDMIKIEFSRDDGTKERKLIYEKWVGLSEEKRESGEVYKVGFHNSQRRANLKPGMVVFSFVQTPEDKDLWLLISVAEIESGERDSYCKFKVLEEYKKHFGELKVRFHKYCACRIFKAKTVIEKCVIVDETSK